MESFSANGRPALIGSLPMDNYAAATQRVLDHTPEIPLWVQLPVFREAGMIAQFMPGLPGVTTEKDRTFIDKGREGFDQEILSFYEDYLMVSDGGGDLDGSRFAMDGAEAAGVQTFIDMVGALPDRPYAIKGQITGPITFGTGVTDREGRAVFYDEELRDVMIKHLALKAAWQTRVLGQFGRPVIVFFDEPALAGFGSSAFLTITKEAVREAIGELSAAVHAQGGLTGVHVCANTEWDLLLDSDLDVISFDAYSYFDKFMLYGSHIKAFLERGGILASGIVPTSPVEVIAQETVDTLFARWEDQASRLMDLGLSRDIIVRQTLITPSCGTGSLPLDMAMKVLEMTRDLSAKVRGL
jgi:methionine synthase II (cobalamin-independent)